VEFLSLSQTMDVRPGFIAQLMEPCKRHWRFFNPKYVPRVNEVGIPGNMSWRAKASSDLLANEFGGIVKMHYAMEWGK